LAEQGQMINSLMQENNGLKIKVDYLEKKISELITKAIKERTIKTDVNGL
jgi:regulator of replication initiation timing